MNISWALHTHHPTHQNRYSQIERESERAYSRGNASMLSLFQKHLGTEAWARKPVIDSFCNCEVAPFLAQILDDLCYLQCRMRIKDLSTTPTILTIFCPEALNALKRFSLSEIFSWHGKFFHVFDFVILIITGCEKSCYYYWRTCVFWKFN